MDSNNLFIEASRKQLRFDANQGYLTTEDLWTLDLKSLDVIAVRVHKRLEAKPTTSFLDNPDKKASAEVADDELRLEILKFVIVTKQDENKAKLARAQATKNRQFLEGLLEKKKLAQLDDMPIEDLEKQLAEAREAEG